MVGASCQRSGTSRRWSDLDTKQVSILLFEGCDLLDAGGPYEVFLTASRLVERTGGERPFTVDMVTVDGEPVTAYGGLGLTPTAPPDVLDGSDIVIIPGAIDLAEVLDDSQLLAAVSSAADSDRSVVASVCTGAFLLGVVDALDGRAWTTHWEDIDMLVERIAQEGATRGVRWVDSDTIVTGGALSSGIALALHLVARETSEELAERTALQLDYDWTNTSLVTDGDT